MWKIEDTVQINACRVALRNDWTFIITEDANALKMEKNIQNGVSIVPEVVFDYVYEWINSNITQDVLKAMMIDNGKGNVVYWEIDFRKTLIDSIVKKNKDFDVEDVSNSLSAFGL